MTVTLHGQAVIDLDEARSYIQDNGAAVGNSDLLKQHINAVTALMQVVTGRKYLKHVADSAITELRDGRGRPDIWTREAPIQKLTSVTLMPYRAEAETITGPGTDAYNEYMWYNSGEGLITMKTLSFPEGNSTVQIVYEAGFTSTDVEMSGMKMIALEAVATKWARYKSQRHGVSSENRGEFTVTYSENDFSNNAMKELRRYRRTLFA